MNTILNFSLLLSPSLSFSPFLLSVSTFSCPPFLPFFSRSFFILQREDGRLFIRSGALGNLYLRHDSLLHDDQRTGVVWTEGRGKGRDREKERCDSICEIEIDRSRETLEYSIWNEVFYDRFINIHHFNLIILLHFNYSFPASLPSLSYFLSFSLSRC